MARQQCTNFPDIAQEESQANIEQKEKIVRIMLTKTWLVVSIFYEFPEHYMEKQCSRHLYFLLKTKAKFTTFRSFWLQNI